MHRALVTGPLKHPWWPLAGHTVPGGKGGGRPLGGLCAGVTPRPPLHRGGGNLSASCCPKTQAAACSISGPVYTPL